MSLRDENDNVLDQKEFTLSKDWEKYEAVFTPNAGTKAGEMTLNFKQGKQSKKVKYVLKDVYKRQGRYR